MRKTLVVVLSLFLVAALAGPAAAQRPVRESGTYQGLSAWTTECSDATRTTCTDTYLDVWESESGSVWVCVMVDSYTIHRDRYRSTGWEDGCGEADAGAFSASRDGTASLAPTAVEIGTWTCSAQTCRLTNGRTITVSASLVGNGSSERTTGRGTDTWENCTYRYTYTSYSGSGDGTMTVDGATSPASGYAEQSTYKTTETCA